MTIKGRGYHLSVLNITVGINLPTHQHRTSRPYPAWRERWPMWHFSMQGLPANNVAIICRELLPHVFNLTPALSKEEGRQLFSVALSVSLWLVSPRTTANPALHRCIALCCPDFPPSRHWRESDNPACSNNFKEATAKIITDFGIMRILPIFWHWLNSHWFSILKKNLSSSITKLWMILINKRFHFFSQSQYIMNFIS